MLLFLFVISIYSQNTKSIELVEFTWIWATDTLGVINIPPDFNKANWHYGEGLVTTLTYDDSSYILLHLGGNMQLPFLDEPDYKVLYKKEYDNKTVRKGKVDKNLFWCEYSFINMTNIAYSKVSDEKIELYNKSLDSFIFLRH